MFASMSLARRIERAERDLVIAMAEAIRARRGAGDVLVAPLGESAAAVFAGVGSPYNKLVGLGLGGPADEDALAEVERELERRKAPLQVELSTLADNSVGAMLTRRGYVLQGFENVLGRRVDGAALAPREGDGRGGRDERDGRDGRDGRGSGEAAGGDGGANAIMVAKADPDEGRGWMDTLVTGFAHPDTSDGPAPHESFPREVLEQAFEDTLATPGFERYLARRGGELAGGASARFFEGVAMLCGAATLPEHRRRGVQTALLRARLSDAARAGCDVAVVTTAPGSTSQENVQRQGFALLYARAILVRAPAS
jgi:GNAT superfamily N-acetyltransferase